MTRAGRSPRAQRVIRRAQVAAVVVAMLFGAAGTAYVLTMLAEPGQIGTDRALAGTSSADAASAMRELAKGGFRRA
ncbi:MAG: hypothetical protein INR72_15555 [Williamsia herbipolensis]|nr:hypothetical protein [Williamsia herbipolensis]